MSEIRATMKGGQTNKPDAQVRVISHFENEPLGQKTHFQTHRSNLQDDCRNSLNCTSVKKASTRCGRGAMELHDRSLPLPLFSLLFRLPRENKE